MFTYILAAYPAFYLTIPDMNSDFGILSGICSDFRSGVLPDILSDIDSGNPSGILLSGLCSRPCRVRVQLQVGWSMGDGRAEKEEKKLGNVPIEHHLNVGNLQQILESDVQNPENGEKRREKRRKEEERKSCTLLKN